MRALVTDKKTVKGAMQYGAFVQNEVKDVGESALDIQVPFDQGEILAQNAEYIKSQLGSSDITQVDIVKMGSDEAKEVPDRLVDAVTPGKPFLWFR